MSSERALLIAVSPKSDQIVARKNDVVLRKRTFSLYPIGSEQTEPRLPQLPDLKSTTEGSQSIHITHNNISIGRDMSEYQTESQDAIHDHQFGIEQKETLTLKEAEVYSNIKSAELRNLIKQGMVESRKEKGIWLITQESLDRYMEGLED